MDVIPGKRVKLKDGRTIVLDAYLSLSGSAKEMLSGELEILSIPRKKVGGINLVRVKFIADGDNNVSEFSDINNGNEYECFYCDILASCEEVI